jgi:hypothetical protein
MTPAEQTAFDWNNLGWWNSVSARDLAPVANTGLLPYKDLLNALLVSPGLLMRNPETAAGAGEELVAAGSVAELGLLGLAGLAVLGAGAVTGYAIDAQHGGPFMIDKSLLDQMDALNGVEIRNQAEADLALNMATEGASKADIQNALAALRAGSTPLSVRIESAVIDKIAESDDYAPTYSLQNLVGPRAMSGSLDPSLGPNQVRYFATMQNGVTGEIVTYSVNYDPDTGNFGIIKPASGR